MQLVQVFHGGCHVPPGNGGFWVSSTINSLSSYTQSTVCRFKHGSERSVIRDQQCLPFPFGRVPLEENRNAFLFPLVESPWGKTEMASFSLWSSPLLGENRNAFLFPLVKSRLGGKPKCLPFPFGRVPSGENRNAFLFPLVESPWGNQAINHNPWVILKFHLNFFTI